MSLLLRLTAAAVLSTGMYGAPKAEAATWSNASVFGPGLWGNTTACGFTLGYNTIGVAHKTLPCGSRVTICKFHKCARIKVIDDGPHVAGRTWDLTEGTTRRVWGMTASQWGVRSVYWWRGW